MTFEAGDFLNIFLQVLSATFLSVCFVCLIGSTCETRKNIYFTWKAYLVLETIEILTF